MAVLLSDKILDGRVYQDIMGECLPALSCIRVGILQGKRLVQVRQFLSNALDQQAVGTASSMFHQHCPFVDGKLGAVCLVNHRYLIVWVNTEWKEGAGLTCHLLKRIVAVDDLQFVRLDAKGFHYIAVQVQLR